MQLSPLFLHHFLHHHHLSRSFSRGVFDKVEDKRDKVGEDPEQVDHVHHGLQEPERKM
jgi:hypothetical protein